MGGERNGGEGGKFRVVGASPAERGPIPAPFRYVVHGFAQIPKLAAQAAQQNHGAEYGQRGHAQYHDRTDEPQARRLRSYTVIEEAAGIAQGQGADLPPQVVSQRHTDHPGVTLQVGPDIPTAAGTPSGHPFLGDEISHETGIGAEQHGSRFIEDLDGEDLLVGVQVLFELLGHALEVAELDAEVDLGLDALADIVQLELESRIEEIRERALEHVRAQHGHQDHAGCQDGNQRKRDSCRQSEGHAGPSPVPFVVLHSTRVNQFTFAGATACPPTT